MAARRRNPPACHALADRSAGLRGTANADDLASLHADANERRAVQFSDDLDDSESAW